MSEPAERLEAAPKGVSPHARKRGFAPKPIVARPCARRPTRHRRVSGSNSSRALAGLRAVLWPGSSAPTARTSPSMHSLPPVYSFSREPIDDHHPRRARTTNPCGT